MKTAIDKIRAIVAWANNMDEHFNDRVRSVSDWDKLYDLANERDIEFIDDGALSPDIDDRDESFMIEANDALGYNLYNIG